jgi:transposase
MQVTTIGLDIAKSSFQIHGADACGKVVLRKRLRRGKLLEFFANLPCCRVGMEACGGAHHWARELTKLGHEVRLIAARRSGWDWPDNQDDGQGWCRQRGEGVARPELRHWRRRTPEGTRRLAVAVDRAKERVSSRQ